MDLLAENRRQELLRKNSLEYVERRGDHHTVLVPIPLLYPSPYARSVANEDRKGVQEHERDGSILSYLGFNLDKAGVNRSEAESGFLKARSLEPDNPWWNSRLVTFYISQGRVAEADAAWAQALKRVDPDGAELVHRPELAKHLHGWVVTAWLDAGDVRRARQVFDRIPQASQSDDAVWERLGLGVR